MWSNLMFNVDAVTDATVHSRSTDFDAVKTFLLSDKMHLDTVKGNPRSFRAWNHQLRAPVLLSTADAVIDRAPLPQAGLQAIIVAPDWRTQLLAVITKSNIAYLLMLLGAYGLIFELMNPGTVLPGTVGAISLLTALFAFNLLLVDYAGAGLVLLGIALLVAEAFIGTFGALGAGGIIAFLFGSIMMFHGNAPGFGLSLSVVLAAIMVSAGVLLLGLALLLRSRRRPIITGGKAMMEGRCRVERWGGQGDWRIEVIRDARQRHRPQGASSHSKAERQSR